jgi:hypothetical protein
MTKLAMAVLIVAACGKSDGTKPGKGSAAAAGSDVVAPAGKQGASGSITVSGAMAGTFDWKDDLALSCSWVPDLNAGNLDITMTDGANTFISLTAVYSKDNTHVKFGSGKLSGDFYEQKAGGVVMSGTGDAVGAHATVTAQIDAVTTYRDKTVNVKGTIKATCN